MVFFAMANAGLPGTSGFVGEFMVILASFRADFWFAFLAATTLIVGAAYTLWMVKRVVFGEVANDKVAALQDINSREFLVLASLAVGGAGARPLAGAADRGDGCLDRRTWSSTSPSRSSEQHAAGQSSIGDRMEYNLANSACPSLPEIFLLSAACLILVVDLFLTEEHAPA